MNFPITILANSMVCVIRTTRPSTYDKRHFLRCYAKLIDYFPQGHYLRFLNAKSVMDKKRTWRHLITGFFLTYFGLQDLPDFNILYNGSALVLGAFSLVLAIIEALKNDEVQNHD